MSPDIQDAMQHIKENDEWAYNLIKYQAEQQQQTIL